MVNDSHTFAFIKDVTDRVLLIILNNKQSFTNIKFVIMKKKLMMVAVLLGALTLGACVDDNESASVTAVRNAKAEQLKSVAAMNNAEAQAKATLAAAEAALMQAQAEAEKANAALVQAQAEIAKKQLELLELQKEEQNIENKKRQAELEAELSRLEVTKKENEKRLAQIAVEMEQMETEMKTALLQAQLAMKQAEQDLLDYEKRLEEAATQAEKEKLEAERRKLQNLAYQYRNAVDELISEQSNLASFKRNLVAMENNLVDLKDAKERAIAENNNRISLNNMRIATYQQYTNYTEDMAALENKYTELNSKNNRLWDNYKAAREAFDGMYVDTKTVNALTEEIENDEFFAFAVRRCIPDDEFRWSIDYSIEQYLPNNYGLLFSGKRYDYKNGDDTYSTFVGDSAYVEFGEFTADIRVVENAVNERRIEMKENGKWAVDGLAKQKALYNGKATIGLYNGTDDKTPCRNAVDSTAYLKNVYEKAAEDVKELAYQNYKIALDFELAQKQNVELFEGWAESWNMDLARLEKAWDMYKNFDAYKAKLQVKMDARNDESVKVWSAKVNAWRTERDSYFAYQTAWTEYDAVSQIYNGITKWHHNEDTDEWWQEIVLEGANSINSKIENLRNENKRLLKANEDLTSIENQKDVITYEKARIEAQEALVKAKEVAVANAKSDLDAAMKATEETPAK